MCAGKLWLTVIVIVVVANFGFGAPFATSAPLANSLFGVVRGSIVEMDPETGALRNSFPASIDPQLFDTAGLAYSGSALYFTAAPVNTIYTVDPATGAITNTFPTPGYTDALAFGRSNFGPTLFALSHPFGQLPELVSLNPETGATYRRQTLDFEALGGMDFNHVTGELFVGELGRSTGPMPTRDGIRRLDPNTGTMLGGFDNIRGEVPFGIGLVGHRLFASYDSLVFEHNITTGERRRVLLDPSFTGFSFHALAGGPPIPEPCTLLLIFIGASAVMCRRARKS